jgi:1,4-dihydroxy-2-naphthoate octaprenyltransferase
MHVASHIIATACILVCFLYQQQIHIWFLLSDVLLLVYQYHTLKFMQAHRKKPNGLKACG